MQRGGGAAPLLIAIGVGMGAFQVGTGVYKLATAKTAQEAENAFFDLGGGTSAIGLSVLGARASLKGVGVDTSKIGYLQATVRNFKEVPTSLSRTYSSFRTGSWKTNVRDVFSRSTNRQNVSDSSKTNPKPNDNPTSLREYAEALQKEGKSQFAGALEEVRSIFPEQIRPLINGRPKGIASILDKLVRKVNKGKSIDGVGKARGEIGDLIGTRLVLDDPTPAQIDLVVSSLTRAIRNKQITITEISNYRGPSGRAYFTDEHMQMLHMAAHESGQEIIFLEAPQLVKPSGYTTIQMNVRHRSSALGEFQIRGRHINRLAEIEHIPYDLRQGKDLSRGITRLAEIFQPVRDAVKSLAQEQYAAYMDYLASYYLHLRHLELGLPTTRPALPNGVHSILEIESLARVAELAH